MPGIIQPLHRDLLFENKHTAAEKAGGLTPALPDFPSVSLPTAAVATSIRLLRSGMSTSALQTSLVFRLLAQNEQ
jgi:hypothetical protein